jgi:hypothetical protein
MGFARFMASPLGRGGRIVLGLVLMTSGLPAVGGEVGTVMAVAGLLPLGSGLINACLFAPILKVPFWGSELPR